VTQGDHYHAFNHSVSWPITLVILAGMAAAGVGLETARLEKRSRDRDHLAERAHSAETGLCEELRNVVDRSGLQSNGRASLFLGRDDHFVLVGRSSPMLKFGQSYGRDIDPINSGLLGEAWNVGSAEDVDLGDPGNDPAAPRARWLARQKKWGVEETVARRFVMRSRAYVAVRIAHNDVRLGVVVLESTTPRATDPGDGQILHPSIGDVETSKEVLARALDHLRKLEDSVLRRHVVAHLPSR